MWVLGKITDAEFPLHDPGDCAIALLSGAIPLHSWVYSIERGNDGLHPGNAQ